MFEGPVEVSRELIPPGAGATPESGADVVGRRASYIESISSGCDGGLRGHQRPAGRPQLFLDEFDGHGGLHRGKSLTLSVQLVGQRQHAVPGGPQVGERGQMGDLLAHVDHRPVGLTKLRELRHCAVGHREGTRLLQHEVAEELVETGQRLGGQGPVQQELSGLGGDAQPTPERGGERRVAVVEPHVRDLPLERPLVDATAEVAEQVRQVCGLVGRVLADPVETLDPGRGIVARTQVEQQEKCHAGAAAVRVGQGDRGERGLGTQVDGGQVAGFGVGSPPPGTTDVGHESAPRSPSRLLLRGGVESQVRRGHEHR